MRKSPPKPEGESPFAFFCICVWEYLFGGGFPFEDTDTVKWEKTNAGYKANAGLSKPGSTAGFQWQTPNKELDPTVAVAKDIFVYISPGNPLAGAGLVDLITNTSTVSRPGIWQALKDIPAKTDAGKYNVPTTPYPTNGGAGDADDANNYWILWSPVPYC